MLGLGLGSHGRRPEEGDHAIISEERTEAVIRSALDAGVTLFDTADSYGESEVLLGKYLKSRRDDVVVATKFGNPTDRSTPRNSPKNGFGARGGRRYLRFALERSLRRLNTDRIDLYQMHAPDPLTPIEETLSTLTDFVSEGRIRYLGSSNFSSWQVVEADFVAQIQRVPAFHLSEHRYNLLDRKIEREIVPACVSRGIGIITWQPLAQGLLTGKYSPNDPPAIPADRSVRRPPLWN